MREIIGNYYTKTDAARGAEGDFAFLRDIFSDQTVYRRQGTPSITGIENLITFYQSDCVIASGNHTVTKMEVLGAKVRVEGIFNGLRKNGVIISDLHFIDTFTFNKSGKVENRETYFPQEEV